MTIMDQVKAYTRMLVQSVIDKEPVNYMEGGGIYGLLIQARSNVPTLCLYYNQAQDPELKKLIREAIDEQTIPAIQKFEELLRAGNAELPDLHFPPHPLYEQVDYPQGLQLTDMEIAMSLSTIARTPQLSLFLAMQQCYQLDVSAELYKLLKSGVEWDYRLLQLMLHRDWLPTVAKIVH